MSPDLHEIRLARLRLGYSQKNIADELGISQSSYSNFENGKLRKTPPDSLLDKVFHVLKLERRADDGPLETDAEGDNRHEEVAVKIIEKLSALETEIGSLKNQLANYLKSGTG